jgi:hypothetical protein
MSTLTTQPVLATTSTEPFGQTGVRQYFGTILALACAVGVAVALAMWYRSHRAADVIDIYHEGGRTMISSSYGRLRVARMVANTSADPSWTYSTRPMFVPRRDPWEPSIWKTIGAEFRGQSVDGPPGGWWFRIKWPLVAGILMAWPLCHVYLQARRTRLRRRFVPLLAAAGVPDVARYCGRCGRPVSREDNRCGHCGRSLQ